MWILSALVSLVEIKNQQYRKKQSSLRLGDTQMNSEVFVSRLNSTDE